MPPTTNPLVHRWAVLTATLTFLLIVVGGLVTSRDAGLAVPDWPTSYGTLNPPRWYAIENVRTEHGHRVIAFLTASAMAILLALVLKFEERRDLRRLAGTAAAAVILQAVLGGLRVLSLNVDFAMVHGCLGQIFFCLVVALATMTSPSWQTKTEPSQSAYLRARMLLVLVATQLVIGIWIRHLGAAARPLMENGVFFVHVGFALAIVAAIVALKLAVDADVAPNARPHRYASLLLGLVALQFVLGLGSFAVTDVMSYDRTATALEAWLPTMHVAIGAAILATTVASMLHLGRPAAFPLGGAGAAAVASKG